MQVVFSPGAEIKFEGANNFRELGGYRAADGRQVKYGLNKWKFTDNPKDRSFIDSLNIRLGIGYGSSKERQKTLPFRQGFSGGILGAVPHYDFYLNNQPWYKSAFGYNNWKYFCTYLEVGSARNEETDMPIFRVEEVMLNYAEAMCELGEFT